MDIYAPFKKYDYILNNKSILLAEKILAVIELWNKISEYDFSSTDLKNVVHLIDWAVLHNMNITLTAEWQLYIHIFRREMLSVLDKASGQLIEVNTGFKNPFEKLMYVVVNTWTNPTLEKLMKISDFKLSTEDVDFFNFEQAYLISIRLMKLCDSNCEDLALNLATAFLKYLKSDHFNINTRISTDQIWFIFDVQVTLLYKFKEIKKLEDILRTLKYEDGIVFINRFVRKKSSLLKIWKYSPKIATLATQIFLEKIVTNNREYSKEVFIQLLDIYVTISNANESLEDFCGKIKKLCEISDINTLHSFCEYLKKLKIPKLQSCIVEIFIKTLTADMNALEQQKDVQNVGEIKLVTSRLADTFSSLAEFMNEKVKVARECVLTAFSLEPTSERLAFLEVLAKKSGLQITNTTQDWKCKIHPPVLPTDEITWQCPECHEYISKPQLDIPLKANLALNEAIQTLDLPETLCEDLIVCISNPRYRVLSWYLPWTVLHRLCLMYLKDQQATKNFVTELKFVDIDYSMFEGIEKEPLDEYGGIEKGYEKYLDKNFIPNEDEDTENVRSENCAIEGEDYDPNSIESLKKILSIQNSQEEEFKRGQTQEGEFSGSRYTPRNPRSILKSSFPKESTNDIQKEKKSINSRNFKRKLQSFVKDKNRKSVKQKLDSRTKQK